MRVLLCGGHQIARILSDTRRWYGAFEVVEGTRRLDLDAIARGLDLTVYRDESSSRPSILRSRRLLKSLPIDLMIVVYDSLDSIPTSIRRLVELAKSVGTRVKLYDLSGCQADTGVYVAR